MGKISDAVNYALAQQGKPYHAYGNRFGPDYFDCSGLMNACLNHTGTPCSATNTVGFYEWGKQTGKLISVDQAIHTYGAMLIKGRWYGFGPLGHIGISLGDGRSMEAVGSRWGCRIMSVYSTRWQDGLIVPGASYNTQTLSPPHKWERDMIIQPHRKGNPAGRTPYAIIGSDTSVFLYNGASIRNDLPPKSSGGPRVWAPPLSKGHSLTGITVREDDKGIVVSDTSGATFDGIWS